MSPPFRRRTGAFTLGTTGQGRTASPAFGGPGRIRARWRTIGGSARSRTGLSRVAAVRHSLIDHGPKVESGGIAPPSPACRTGDLLLIDDPSGGSDGIRTRDLLRDRQAATPCWPAEPWRERCNARSANWRRVLRAGLATRSDVESRARGAGSERSALLSRSEASAQGGTRTRTPSRAPISETGVYSSSSHLSEVRSEGVEPSWADGPRASQTRVSAGFTTTARVPPDRVARSPPACGAGALLLSQGGVDENGEPAPDGVRTRVRWFDEGNDHSPARIGLGMNDRWLAPAVLPLDDRCWLTVNTLSASSRIRTRNHPVISGNDSSSARSRARGEKSRCSIR